jgi:AhpD family alkylhydroperoxidase
MNMSHINLPPNLPGIRGPMAFRPETATPLNELVDVLLRGPNSLSPGERELIATYVSSENDCRYCQTIHVARAREQGATDLEIHDTVLIAAVFCMCNRLAPTWRVRPRNSPCLPSSRARKSEPFRDRPA